MNSGVCFTLTAHLNVDRPHCKCPGAVCDQGLPHRPAEVQRTDKSSPSVFGILVPIGTISGEDKSLRPALVGISSMNTLKSYCP